jgi:hypothetical protein
MRQISLALLGLIVPIAWAVDVAAADVPGCQQALKELIAPHPPYPSPEQAKRFFMGTSYMHVFVEGRVLVEYVVIPSGVVTEVRVIESSYNLVGQNRNGYSAGYFDGFLEMNVTATLGRWKYQPIEQACKVQRTFTYVVDPGA